MSRTIYDKVLAPAHMWHFSSPYVIFWLTIVKLLTINTLLPSVSIPIVLICQCGYHITWLSYHKKNPEMQAYVHLWFAYSSHNALLNYHKIHIAKFHYFRWSTYFITPLIKQNKTQSCRSKQNADRSSAVQRGLSSLLHRMKRMITCLMGGWHVYAFGQRSSWPSEIEYGLWGPDWLTWRS